LRRYTSDEMTPSLKIDCSIWTPCTLAAGDFYKKNCVLEADFSKEAGYLSSYEKAGATAAMVGRCRFNLSNTR